MFQDSDSPRERGSRSRQSFLATLVAGSAGVVAARSVAAWPQAPAAAAQAPAAARSIGVSAAGLPKVRITKIDALPELLRLPRTGSGQLTVFRDQREVVLKY